MEKIEPNKRNKIVKIQEITGITLIALIITIIVLLILAAITINFVIGDNGIIQRGKEANFKTKMSSMAEEVKLYSAWEVTKTQNTDISWINAGIMLKDMIQQEMLDITEEQLSFQISDILPNSTKQERDYIAIYKGEMYYVSSNKIKNNQKNIQWCQEINIPILYNNPPTGIVVINGKYEKVKGLYLSTPQLTDGFVKEKTRYLNIDEKGNLTPGNWLTNRASDNWYDYKNGQWANIYVENNGIETYYTWIPRYAFKLDQQNQKSIVKFINVEDNSYIEVKEDETEIKYEWSKLEKEGYQIPESFSWVNEKGETIQLPGYWVSKYTLDDLKEYTLDYEMIANINSILVKDIKKNTSNTVEKYTYALNGTIVKESTTPDNYEFTNLRVGDNIINITALDGNGEIIGSMTKVYSPAIVNPPDLTGFNQDTTFYVTWDANGIEHSEIPITKEPPTAWYEYGASMWANIVTRNNGVETYYTWIPRYEFSLDQLAQRSIVKFIKGASTQTSGNNYQIPESFSWVNEKGETVQLTGYWVSKYTLGDETAPRFDTEVTATSNSIKTKPITGSAVTSGQKYMYYIDGEYRQTLTNSNDSYEYTGLTSGKKYTVNIIIRNNNTDEYIGSITKQITTIEPNRPDLTGFNPEVTYYCFYDVNGNEQIGDKIKIDGSNAPRKLV
ncbi:MAG: hypothetical protein HFJ27_04710 [Clostridia bacterium]|nr:hypothetical protein [Clostridia bacterium]